MAVEEGVGKGGGDAGAAGHQAALPDALGELLRAAVAVEPVRVDPTWQRGLPVALAQDPQVEIYHLPPESRDFTALHFIAHTTFP